MQRRFLTILGLLLWVASTNVSLGFSLLGPLSTPATAWQTPAIGYQLPGDIGGPVNEGEEYRWNVPTITYAFDQTFLSFFGQDGVDAVESALGMINDLGPVSELSPELLDFPPDALKPNQTALAFGVQDVKTTTLHLVLELMGLADSYRFTWCIRQRVPHPTMGFTNYTVIQRNFDPVTYDESPYVNEVLYSYHIADPIPPRNYADALELAVDQVSFAPINPPLSRIPSPGVFATGLSRDDVGGLRYIYRAQNYHVETLVPGITLATNAIGNVNSPWVPYLGITNLLTNVFGTTNIVGSNTIVNVALRPGIETLSFVRVNYDSLLSQTFVPITNLFTDVIISNSTAVLQRAQRITRQPDFLFTAADLGFFPVPNDDVIILYSRGANFVNNEALNRNGPTPRAGPGVIQPQAIITYTTLLPAFVNSSSSLDGPGAPILIWGSFDASDDIIFYPKRTSIQTVERMVLGQ